MCPGSSPRRASDPRWTIGTTAAPGARESRTSHRIVAARPLSRPLHQGRASKCGNQDSRRRCWVAFEHHPTPSRAAGSEDGRQTRHVLSRHGHRQRCHFLLTHNPGPKAEHIVAGRHFCDDECPVRAAASASLIGRARAVQPDVERLNGLAGRVHDCARHGGEPNWGNRETDILRVLPHAERHPLGLRQRDRSGIEARGVSNPIVRPGPPGSPTARGRRRRSNRRETGRADDIGPGRR